MKKHVLNLLTAAAIAWWLSWIPALSGVITFAGCWSLLTVFIFIADLVIYNA